MSFGSPRAGGYLVDGCALGLPLRFVEGSLGPRGEDWELIEVFCVCFAFVAVAVLLALYISNCCCTLYARLSCQSSLQRNQAT